MAVTASSSYATYLMYKNSMKFEKLIDIKNCPALGGDPELIDITTLSDKQKRNILGIENVDSLEFTANYTLNDMKKLEALELKETEFQVWFSTKGLSPEPSSATDADEGVFGFKGYLRAYPAEAEVNSVREIKIVISNTTPIELVEAA